MLIDLMRSYGNIKILHSYVLKMNPLQDLSFQTVSFSGTFVATTSAKFFSEFHAPLHEPSFLIVFFSDNWRRQVFFSISFSVSFCHHKRHHQEPYQIVSNTGSCNSQCAGL